ncbi:hypothetical protein [Virgibacillus halodenitrificans]
MIFVISIFILGLPVDLVLVLWLIYLLKKYEER